MRMLVLKSKKQHGIKYFFDPFKIFPKDSIEKGYAFSEAKGKLVNSLEISLISRDAINNPDLKKILDDCCPGEISNQGIKACISYIKSFGTQLKSFEYDGKGGDKIYIHTIQD